MPMPTIEHLNSPAFAALGLPFSEIVRVGDTLYLSGQMGTLPGTVTLAPGGLEAQARQALENIRAALSAHGFGLDFQLHLLADHVGPFGHGEIAAVEHRGGAEAGGALEGKRVAGQLVQAYDQADVMAYALERELAENPGLVLAGGFDPGRAEARDGLLLRMQPGGREQLVAPGGVADFKLGQLDVHRQAGAGPVVGVEVQLALHVREETQGLRETRVFDPEQHARVHRVQAPGLDLGDSGGGAA